MSAIDDARRAAIEKAFALLSGGYDYDVAAATASARAQAGDWTSDGPSASTRDFIAYVLASEDTARAVEDEHPDASKALSRSWVVLAKQSGWKEGQSVPKGDNPTEANAIAIVAIIVGVAAIAAVVIYVIYRASQIVAEQLALRAANQELMRAHDDAKVMIEAHRAAEAKAGHAIPYDAGELATLQALVNAQDELGKVEVGTVGNAGKPPIDPGAGDGFMLGAIAAGLAVAYLVLKK